MENMNQRSRKALGILFTFGFLLLYSLAVMAGSAVYIIGAPMIVELSFFIAAGLLWLPVVMAIIRWMNKP